MLRTKWMGVRATLVTIGLLMVASSSHAVTCSKDDGIYHASITVVVNNTPPTILCQAGVDVIEITINSVLQDDEICLGLGSTKRCGNTSDAFLIFPCDQKTVVKPAPGKTWADAAADCNNLVFDVVGN